MLHLNQHFCLLHSSAYLQCLQQLRREAIQSSYLLSHGCVHQHPDKEVMKSSILIVFPPPQTCLFDEHKINIG